MQKVCTNQEAQQAGAYPGFRSMKRLIVFLFPPGWDASLPQGYPPALNSSVLIYTPGCRQPLLALSTLPKNTSQCPRPGLEPKPLDPESSTLTMRQPRLHRRTGNIELIYVITRFLMTIITSKIYSFRQ